MGKNCNLHMQVTDMCESEQTFDSKQDQSKSFDEL